MKAILLSLLLILTISNIKAECLSTPYETSLEDLSKRPLALPINGLLKIYTGDDYAQIVDIFRKRGEPFSGLVFSSEREDDTDTRFILWRKLFPREPKPPKMYMYINLSSEVRERYQGLDDLNLYLTIKSKNTSYSVELDFSSNLSRNCIP